MISLAPLSMTLSEHVCCGTSQTDEKMIIAKNISKVTSIEANPCCDVAATASYYLLTSRLDSLSARRRCVSCRYCNADGRRFGLHLVENSIDFDETLLMDDGWRKINSEEFSAKSLQRFHVAASNGSKAGLFLQFITH